MTNTKKPGLTEDEMARRGEMIARLLYVSHDPPYKDRWQTTAGNKTNLGLFRIVERIVLDGE